MARDTHAIPYIDSRCLVPEVSKILHDLGYKETSYSFEDVWVRVNEDNYHEEYIKIEHDFDTLIFSGWVKHIDSPIEYNLDTVDKWPEKITVIKVFSKFFRNFGFKIKPKEIRVYE